MWPLPAVLRHVGMFSVVAVLSLEEGCCWFSQVLSNQAYLTPGVPGAVWKGRETAELLTPRVISPKSPLKTNISSFHRVTRNAGVAVLVASLYIQV